jgi:hypothetical protein
MKHLAIRFLQRQKSDIDRFGIPQAEGQFAVCTAARR